MLKIHTHILALYILVSFAKSSVNIRKVPSPSVIAFVSKDVFYKSRCSPLDLPPKLRLRGGHVTGPSQSDLESVKTGSKPELESQDDAAADAEIEALISQLEGNLTGVYNSEAEAALFEEEERPLKEKATLFPTHLPSLYNYARFLQVHKNYDAAMELYLKCLQLEPKESWKEGLAHSYCNHGLILHAHRGNSSGAEHYYKQALSIDPDHVYTLNNYGKLLEGGEKTSSRVTLKMDLDGAENLYSRALQADSDHVPTLINFAYFKEKVREAHDEAESMYVKALRLEPDNVIALRDYAGFLCNVREPYDPDTGMPVHFNATCNAPGTFDFITGLPINPKVDRPVDRARALYNRVLELQPVEWVGVEEETLLPRLADPFPLAHGAMAHAVAPPLPAGLDPADAAAALAALDAQAARARALLAAGN